MPVFRASPWIPYDPPASDGQPSQPTDNDVDMDTPQISTLHDEGESPPSNASPARTGKFRVTLLVNEAKMGRKFITFNGETGEEAAAAEDAEEDEPDDDEEDELIEDEGDASTPAASSSGAGPSSSAKAGTKRPSTRTKSSQARRKARLSAPSAALPPAPPTGTAASSETQSGSPATKDARDSAPSTEPLPTAPQQTTPATSAPPPKKKAVPKGTTAAQRAPRKSAPKTKAAVAAAAAATLAVIPPITETAAAAEVSEGYAGTVPSSPAAHVDARTPEPEPEPESAPPPDAATSSSVFATSATEPMTLEDIEGVPHPRYPLPTKPFQVQPAPKITTGYAPIIPLGHIKSKSRHWRMAHREVRGIAGGRWFARSWVGDKDSELAVATEAALSLPKLPALSISTSSAGTRTPGKRKPKADALSTAASSRSASAVPEGAAPPAPLQRPATKKSALSTAVAASDVDMDIDLVS